MSLVINFKSSDTYLLSNNSIKVISLRIYEFSQAFHLFWKFLLNFIAHLLWNAGI